MAKSVKKLGRRVFEGQIVSGYFTIYADQSTTKDRLLKFISRGFKIKPRTIAQVGVYANTDSGLTLFSLRNLPPLEKTASEAEKIYTNLVEQYPLLRRDISTV